MSVGLRLREERLRLGIGQPAFAAMAGATKSALVKWEKDEASPNAKGLIAWAEAGADLLYILTGRRTNDRPETAANQIEDQLAGIRRDIVDPSRQALPGESEERTEKRMLERHAHALASILRYDTDFLTPEMRDEVEHLYDIVTNSAALSLFRAADYVQMRSKRREMRERIVGWFFDDRYVPSEAVASLMAALAMDYSVPVKHLVELVEEVRDDVVSKSSDA